MWDSISGWPRVHPSEPRRYRALSLTIISGDESYAEASALQLFKLIN